MKIPKGPYIALGPLHTKMPRDQTPPSKIQGGKFVTKHDRETGGCLQPELPLLNAKFYFAGNNF